MTLSARLSHFIVHFAEKLWSLGVTCPGNPITHAGVMLILARIQSLPQRLQAIADRLAAGTLRPAAPPVSRSPSTKPRPPTQSWPDRMPGSHAWLVRLSLPFAPFGTQLAHLLRDPEMQALIQAAPQVRRLFRPLCCMLGCTVLKPPPAPQPPAPKPPAPKPPAPKLPAPKFPAPGRPASPARPRHADAPHPRGLRRQPPISKFA